jgi:uncharacterized membrane protein YphA (DoxX/SURF4 family)
MSGIVPVLQVVVALGILNVWLLRFGKATAWRGGSARSMREEFAVYGLPPWLLGVVGSLKVLFALLLIAGVFFPPLTKPAAAGLAVLMLGAVSMHLKVGDPARKSLPALSMLALCAVVAVA